MLDIQNLTVKVQQKTVLKNITLTIPDGETHILFGPNGSGKSSLLLAILGYPEYRVIEGKILYRDQNITKMPIDERAKSGIGMMFQHPPSIKGLRLSSLLQYINSENYKEFQPYVEKLRGEGLVGRDINVGFSGGERKRAEMIQLMVQQPGLTLFDEPESGVDVENMKIIGKVARDLVQGGKIGSRKKSALIITHTGYILDYVSADKGYILLDGRIRCRGNPTDMFRSIQKNGFASCICCEK